MGIFGRKKRDSRHDGANDAGRGAHDSHSTDPVSLPPDGYLPLLSIEHANRLRSLSRIILAESGYEVDVFGDHLRSDSQTFGLDNVMRIVHGSDPAEWESLVRRHFDAILRPADAEPDDDERRQRIISRLWDTAAADDRMSFDYALEWQSGVGELLTLDYPDRVSVLSDAAVRKIAPLGPWYDRARRNLFRELTEVAKIDVETVEHEGRRIFCALSDSVYVASGALFLPDLLPRWAPGIDLSGGVLFAIACRNQLAFSPCSNADGAIAGLMLLPGFAVNGYSDGVGPVSPNVYFWHGGLVTQVSRIADGALTVTPPEELLKYLQ